MQELALVPQSRKKREQSPCQCCTACSCHSGTVCCLY